METQAAVTDRTKKKVSILEDAFTKLSLSSSRLHQPDDELQSALKRIGFSHIQCVHDFGFFGWTFDESKIAIDKVTVSHLMSRLLLTCRLPEAMSLHELNRKCPKSFAASCPYRQKYNSLCFPHYMPSVVPLYVAVKDRGYDLTDIDFVFDGCALFLFATGNFEIDDHFMVELFTMQGSKKHIIMIKKENSFIQNFACFGFQFERFITGGSFTDRHDTTRIERLHILDVHGHRLLIHAECDALHPNGHPMEIKAGNPYYFDTKVLLQMISSGSLHLWSAKKLGKERLNGVAEYTLSQIARKGFAKDGHSVVSLERNLKINLDSLKSIVQSKPFTDVQEIKFVGKWISLKEPDGTNSMILRNRVKQDFMN